VFERFTENARATIVFAQEEGRLLKHNYVGTEHVLLGLLRERTAGSTVAGRVLASLEVSLDAARSTVRAIIGEGPEPPGRHIPFTPRARRVLHLANGVADARDSRQIGTEHLLLGMIREGHGVGCQVLADLGVNADQVRRAVQDELGDPPGVPPLGPVEGVRLRPMRDDEWDAWRARTVSEYADEKVRNKGVTPGKALTQAEQETTALLSGGLGTPGHHLFVAENDAGTRVGYLWFGPRLGDPDPDVAWLYDIFVEEAARGRGFGRAMMERLEVAARELGHHRIELNVFGDNVPAKRLYEAAGYLEMTRQLRKDLDP
jgi:ribosomal protein S18 acetylase RimI-like enzyme